MTGQRFGHLVAVHPTGPVPYASQQVTAKPDQSQERSWNMHNRGPLPSQCPGDGLPKFGIRRIVLRRHEVDTMARRSVGVCDRVLLYSGDKDFMQLLDERVAMLKPGKGGDNPSELTADGVRKEYGMEPANLIQVFALAGDQADNRSPFEQHRE